MDGASGTVVLANAATMGTASCGSGQGGEAVGSGRRREGCGRGCGAGRCRHGAAAGALRSRGSSRRAGGYAGAVVPWGGLVSARHRRPARDGGGPGARRGAEPHDRLLGHLDRRRAGSRRRGARRAARPASGAGGVAAGAAGAAARPGHRLPGIRLSSAGSAGRAAAGRPEACRGRPSGADRWWRQRAGTKEPISSSAATGADRRCAGTPGWRWRGRPRITTWSGSPRPHRRGSPTAPAFCSACAPGPTRRSATSPGTVGCSTGW